MIPGIQITNDVLMPIVGLGTYNIFDEAVIQDALSVGYRMIDTARMYNNEEVVGRAVKNSGLPRDEIFLTTKLDRSCDSYEKAKKAIDSSLQNLKTDVIDLLLVHEVYTRPFEMYQACVDAYRSGKVRAIGISNFRKNMYDALLAKAEIVPMVNQMESHVYYPQLSYAKYMKEHGTSMQAWGSLTEGIKDVLHEPILLEIGRKHNKTSAQIALKYIVQNGIGIIPKSSNHERLIQNIDLFDFTLDQEDLTMIEQLDENHSLVNWY